MIIHAYPPVKMEPTVCSETSAFNIQTPGKYPDENIPYLQHCESLKTTINCIARRKVIHLSSVQYHIYLHAVEQILHYYQNIIQNEDEIIFYSVRYLYVICTLHSGGRCRADYISTRCGLDGQGIKSRFRRYFLYLSSPATSPPQPAV
jgi:hypothetical protein